MEVPHLMRRLQADLRSLKYPEDVDYGSASQGSPIPFLPVLSYCLVKYSRPVTQDFLSKGYALSPSNDSSFVQTLYKILRNEFDYNPVLSPSQFLTKGYTEKRTQMVLDIIRIIKSHNQQLQQSRTGVVISVRESKDRKSDQEPPPRPRPKAVPSPVPRLQPIQIRDSTSIDDTEDQPVEFTNEPTRNYIKPKPQSQTNPNPNIENKQQVIDSFENEANVSEMSLKAISSTLNSMNTRISSTMSLIEQRLAALEVRVKMIEQRVDENGQ
ncbi:hypothetical protein P9112_003365 [Eukaryota sp. TZLM1-RC]